MITPRAGGSGPGENEARGDSGRSAQEPQAEETTGVAQGWKAALKGHAAPRLHPAQHAPVRLFPGRAAGACPGRKSLPEGHAALAGPLPGYLATAGIIHLDPQPPQADTETEARPVEPLSTLGKGLLPPITPSYPADPRAPALAFSPQRSHEGLPELCPQPRAGCSGSRLQSQAQGRRATG